MDANLVKAVAAKNLEGVKQALDEGANPNALDRNREPVISNAATYGNLEIVRLLLDRGADPNARDSYNHPPLRFAIQFPEVVSLLLDKGADPTARGGLDELEQTPYIHAINKDALESAKLLVEKGVAKGFDKNAIINAKDGMGRHASFYVRSADGVRRLAEDGVDLNARERGIGSTLLTRYIGYDKNDSIVLALIDQNVDVNLADDTYGSNPLVAAARNHKEPRVIKALLDKGADINHKTADGSTALMIASQMGRERIVTYLLERGADRTLTNLAGETALDLAKDDEMRDILRAPIGPEQPSGPWKGLTQADVGLFDTLFEDMENYSCCPYCLAYTQRSASCRYMTHSCKLQPRVMRHLRLYDLFKNDENRVQWCTICGRPCAGHRHYQLVASSTTERPPLAPIVAGVSPFGGEENCLRDGGGGYAEKVKRLNAIRNTAKELQSQVNVITEKQAREKLVESAWDAARSDAPTAEIMASRRFTVPASDFPAAPAPAPAEAPGGPAPDIPKPADEIANVPEIVAEGGMDSFELDDVAPAVRFVHKKKDGTVYRHTDDQLIGRNGLTNFLRAMNGRFGTEEFGLCFAMPDCDAKLWPQDVRDIVDDPAVYEEYRQKFNEKFQAPLAGGAHTPLFVEMTNGECALPEKTKKAGTYRRRQTRRRKTYRRKFMKK